MEEGSGCSSIHVESKGCGGRGKCMGYVLRTVKYLDEGNIMSPVRGGG